MGKIRAVIVDPEAPARLGLGEVEEPEPAPSEALVRVSAISLNRGEVRRSQEAEAGFRPGWGPSRDGRADRCGRNRAT